MAADATTHASVLELRAKQAELQAELKATWEDTMRLMDVEEERKGASGAGAGAVVHLSLAWEYARHGVGQLLGRCTGGVGAAFRAVASLHPTTASCVGALEGVVRRCGAEPRTSPEALTVARASLATSQQLTRRAGRRTEKTKESEAAKEEKRQRNMIYVPEDKWETSDSRGVFFPPHPTKQRWDAFVMLLIIYSCIDVPFRIGMNAEAEGLMWLGEVGITLMFCVDLACNFNTAYLEGPNFVIHRGMIAGTYFQSWFFIDALSSIPVELIEALPSAVPSSALGALGGGGGGGAADEGNTGMKALRALRMVRLLRMLRLLKVQQYIDALEDRTGVNMQILQIVKMVLGLLYLMHLLGCFWFYVATNSGEPITWVTEYDGGSAVSAPTSVQYLYSVYWALTTLTTVGYGDIIPTNNAERLYALASLLVGALVFGYMLSSIGDLLSNVDKNAVKLEGKLGDVKDFTRWHRMGPELAARVRKYYEVYYGRQSAMDEAEIIANLAPTLRREVVGHLLAKTCARIPMFSNEYCDYASEAFQLEVHPLLKPVVLEMDEDAVPKHAHGDALFFLNKGTVGAMSALSAFPATLFAITDAGAFVGEHVLCNRPCELTYRALTRCEFFCLSKQDLFALLERFPEARTDLSEFVFEDYLRHKMLRYWAFRMLVPDVKPRDATNAAALQLQLAWMRRDVINLQSAHAHYGERTLMQLMPGVYGLEGADGATPRSAPPVSDGTARSGLSAGGVSASGLTQREMTAVMGAVSSLDSERARLQKRDQQMGMQIGHIQAALDKLVAERHEA